MFNSGTGNLTLTDCTVSGNTGVYGGGGLSNYGGTSTLIDCTVSGNDAAVWRRRMQLSRHGHPDPDRLHRQRQHRRRTSAAACSITARPT